MSDLFQTVAEDSAPSRHEAGSWVRRSLLLLFTGFVVVALVGVFGQQPEDKAVAAPAAQLRLSAPAAVRGGLFFQSRIDIRAQQRIQDPHLVLDHGWLEGMQVNSIIPEPVSQASRDGKLVLTYDTLEPGDTLIVWMQFEVDPTNVGHRPYGVELDDAGQRIAAIHHKLTIFP